MISTKGTQTEGKPQEYINKYLEPGFNLAAIMGYDLRTAQSGKVQLSFHMEATPEKGNFEGATWRQSDKDAPEVKAKGKYSSVKLGIYFDQDDENRLQKILSGLGSIADAVGKRKEVDAISADTLDAYLQKYVNIVKGIMFWSKFKAEEYEKGKYNLSFAEYQSVDKEWFTLTKSEADVVKVETITEPVIKQTLYYIKGNETKTFKYDRSSKWDYKEVETSDSPAELRDSVVEDDDI